MIFFLRLMYVNAIENFLQYAIVFLENKCQAHKVLVAKIDPFPPGEPGVLPFVP